MSGAVRVATRIGKKPVIFVAPHGADDIKTDVIAERAAETLDSYAVVNKGFDRSDVVDTNNDKANCNRIDHTKDPVVYDEFLKPILNFRNNIKRKLYTGPSPVYSVIGGRGWGWHLPNPDDKKVLVFYIHGAGDKVHSTAGESVGCIVGYGLGQKKDSLTCDLWRKNLFIDIHRNYSTDGEIFEGRGAGKYAGRHTNNMNQYFRKHELDPWVACMQLEIPYSHRKTESRAVLTAILLSTIVSDMLDMDSYELEPQSKFI